MIWKIAPKVQHSGTKIVVIAANIAIYLCNEGTFSLLQIMQAMKIVAGWNAHQYATRADKRRIAQAERAARDDEKKWECVIDKPNSIWQGLISQQKMYYTALE